jgi:hypothetical protein
MNVFKSSFSVFLKIYQREKLFIIGFFVVIIETIAQFYFHIRIGDAVGLVNKSQYSQMLSMFFFLTLGLHIVQIEETNGFRDVIEYANNEKSKFSMAKIVYVSVVPIVLYAVLVAFCFASFYIIHAPYEVYIYGCKMFALYFLLPGLICSYLGIIIGAQIKSRLKYFALLLVWMIVSPISTEATAYFFEIFQTTNTYIRYLFSLINLGGRITLGNTPIYGFTFEPINAIAGILKLFILLVYTFLLLMIDGIFVNLRNRYRLILNISFLSVFLIAASTLHTHDIEKILLYGSSTENISTMYDKVYHSSIYSENELKENLIPLEYENRLIPKSYDIRLDTGLCGVEVTCSVKALVCNEKKSQKQVFTLYHDLRVKSVKLNGEELNYLQQLDYCIVDLPSNLQSDSNIILNFTYSGSTSPLYQATDGAVQLTGSFPWLPEIGVRTPISHAAISGTKDFVLYSTENQQSSIYYNLSFVTNLPIYTNLKNTGTNTWSGVSTTGVTIVANSLLKTAEIDGETIYYSANIKPKIQEVVNTAKQNQLLYEDLQDLLYGDTSSEFDEMVVFPVAPTFEYRTDLFTYQCGNTTFLYLPDQYKVNGILHYKDSKESRLIDTISALESQPAVVKACVDEPVNLLFISLVVKYTYSEKMGKDYSDIVTERYNPDILIDEIVDIEPSGNAYYTQQSTLDCINQIKEYIKNIDYEKDKEIMKKLIPLWYSAICSYDKITPEKVIETISMGESK